MAILDWVKLLAFFVEQSLRCSVTVMFRGDLCRILSKNVERELESCVCVGVSVVERLWE